ncbi:uncharacterized protein LOC136096846 [Hydra vulgaris]|uniref:uncharacterized protein LOC136096846 n=1 Tax=Hydra vulgaris TaxID=6087 RepID=UPI0032EA6F96
MYEPNDKIRKMYEPNDKKRMISNITMKKLFLPNWKGSTGEEFTKMLKKEKKNITIKMREKAIVNLSSKKFTESELNIINKGLKFIISPQRKGKNCYREEVIKFKRRIELKMFFSENKNEYKEGKKYKNIAKKSEWTPPTPKNKKIRRFLKIVELKTEEILKKRLDNSPENISNNARKILLGLTKDHNIIFKQTDKGGGICILDTKDYESKVLEMLNDNTTYKLLTNNPMARIINEVHDLINYMFRKESIDKTVREMLKPNNPCRKPLFYGLPKVHKVGIPLRPIVSGCEGPTDNLSRFVTGYIQPLVEKLPAYFKDSTELLRILGTKNTTVEDYWLVTADVTSLYTNIPHEEGIEALKHYLTIYKDFSYPEDIPPRPPISHLIRIVKTILENSAFGFGSKDYLQISGTSMGTRMAPPYANLFMGLIDEKIIGKFSNTIQHYKRFIDDIFFIFLGNEEELNCVKQFMNSIHKSIKFTFNVSKTEVAFMDLLLSKNKYRGLTSTLYKKPTDTCSLLHFKSHHPRHQKEGLIYSQALRLNKIIRSENNLKGELENLARTLITKGYPLEMINFNIKKALKYTQRELIEEKIKNNENEISPIAVVMPNDQRGQLISIMIQKTWIIIEKDSTLNKIFPMKTRKVFSNNKSLKEKLISTKFQI